MLQLSLMSQTRAKLPRVRRSAPWRIADPNICRARCDKRGSKRQILTTRLGSRYAPKLGTARHRCVLSRRTNRAYSANAYTH